jgi:hypothetical protein
LQAIGVTTLRDVVESAVREALSDVPPSASTEAARDTRSDPTGSLSPFRDELRNLALWAEREASATTFGELLGAATNSGVELPPDVLEAWNALLAEPLSAIAQHPPAPKSLGELFDRLLGNLEGRQREILIARSLSSHPRTLHDLGRELGLTRERVRQLQVKAEARLAELIGEEQFAPLRWRAQSLRSVLGPRVSASSSILSEALADASSGLGSDPGLLGRLLLRLAGYKEQAKWFLRSDASSVSPEALEEAADENGLLPVARALQLLDAAGVAAPDYDAALSLLGTFRRFGDTLAVWKGSVVDKAVRVLAILGRPATPAEILEVIAEGHAERSLRNRLFDDPRLMRVSKNRWALRSSDLEEYSGVADEIAEEIERQGGRASLSHLVDVLTSTFGIAEGSVRAYSQTPRFVIESGAVRLRRDDERYAVAVASIADSRGCFRDSPTSVTFCVGVDSEVLRGSGRSLPSAVAGFVGLMPGNEQHFQIQPGDEEDAHVVLTWPVDSVTGPSLGSIRLLAARTDAEEGDLLRLTFDPTDSTLRATRLSSSVLIQVSDLERLSLITGLELDRTSALERLAESLGVEPESVRRVLHARGDGELVAMLPKPASNADLDAALAELQDSLLREK